MRSSASQREQSPRRIADSNRKALLGWWHEWQAGAVLLPWVIFALSNVAFKLWIYLSLSRHTPMQSLAVLRWDLLGTGVVLPLAVLCLAALLPRRWAVRVSITVFLIAQLVLCIDFAIFRTLGTFVPVGTILNLLHWLVTTGDTHVLVVSGPVVVWLASLFVLAMIVSWWVVRATPTTRRVLDIVAVIALAVCAIVGLSALVPHAISPELTPAILQIAAQKAFAQPEASAEALGRSLPELMGWYRASAKIPPADPAYAGKARGYNVVFFIMESIPAEVFDPAGDLSAMPNVAKLREHAFVGRQHYTTYPYTSYAVFGIFSSLYIQSAAGTLIEDRKQSTPGIIRALNDSGYQSAYYGFLWKNLYSRDDRMIASLGFETVKDAATNPNNDIAAKQMYTGPAQAVVAHDEQALQLMRDDIHTWAGKRQPFVAAYFPELGHDPWRELGQDRHQDARAVGHALAVKHDAWIGALLQQLAADGILDRTIIVITADHGVRLERSSASDPSHTVSPGQLDERVFRVPLLVYVPGVLQQTEYIDGPTSHIDLQPTVLSLLGVDRMRNVEEGVAIWNSRIRERRLFLATVGAEGFCSEGICYSKPGLGPLTKAAGLDFAAATPVPADSTEAAEVKHALAEHHALQHAILDHVLETSHAE